MIKLKDIMNENKGKLHQRFYVVKINGKWKEFHVERRGNNIKKSEVLPLIQKYDKSVKLKDIYTSINAPQDVPDVFDDTITLEL